MPDSCIRKIYPEAKDGVAGWRGDESFGQRPESESAAGVAQGKHGRGGQSHRTAPPNTNPVTLRETHSHPRDVTPPSNR
jgi:hypothetical protein